MLEFSRFAVNNNCGIAGSVWGRDFNNQMDYNPWGLNGGDSRALRTLAGGGGVGKVVFVAHCNCHTEQQLFHLCLPSAWLKTDAL